MELFENQQINIDDLPRIEQIEYLRPQKNLLWLNLIKSLVFWFIMWALFSLSLFAASEEFYHLTPYAKMVFYPFAIFSILLTIIGYYKRGHSLRAYDIIYKQGVLYLNTTTISFNRVQHCEISQGPFEQLFDLFTLKVFTAGGQSSDLEIPGLDENSATSLKEYIIDATAKKKSISEEE